MTESRSPNNQSHPQITSLSEVKSLSDDTRPFSWWLLNHNRVTSVETSVTGNSEFSFSCFSKRRDFKGSGVAKWCRKIYSRGFYFLPRAGGEVRIFGFYKSKQKTKKGLFLSLQSRIAYRKRGRKRRNDVERKRKSRLCRRYILHGAPRL